MKVILLFAVTLFAVTVVDVDFANADERAAIQGTLAPDVVTTVPTPERKGEDWPCFLGSRGTGECAETNWLKKWPEDGPEVAWQKRIGTGYSARRP